MSDILYAREKFNGALYSLVGDGSLQKRLLNAYMSFHPIKASDFKDPDMRTKYEEIMRRLTVVSDVPATLDQMINEEAQSLSCLILELAFDINEARTLAN